MVIQFFKSMVTVSTNSVSCALLGHEVDVGHATLCRELYQYRYEYLSINIQVQYAQCNYSLYDIIIFRGWEWGGLGHLAVSS